MVYITHSLTDRQVYGALSGIALCFGTSDFTVNRIKTICMSHGFLCDMVMIYSPVKIRNQNRRVYS